MAEKKALERIADAVEKIASAYDLELVEQEPAEIPDFEGTREMIAGLTLGKTAAPGESEGETEGPVTPQSAPGAADMTHYVGDSCPGGHRSEAEIVENKMAEALLKELADKVFGTLVDAMEWGDDMSMVWRHGASEVKTLIRRALEVEK